MTPGANGAPVLQASGISAGYGSRLAVRDVELRVAAGEILGLAGESGCGKSSLALALMGFTGGGLHIRGGRSVVNGRDLLQMSAKERRLQWGCTIAYVPQGAAAALNPAQSISTQFRLVLRRHLQMRSHAADQLAGEWMEKVGLPRESLSKYPHQFSGGQQQRISLALALSCGPSVLLLDEPTTGLDVTTQAQITTMLRRLVDELGVATIYVSHDLHLLSRLADQLAVMYAGELVETGRAEQLLGQARHPYSRALLRAAPTIDGGARPEGIPGAPPAAPAEMGCSFSPRCRLADAICASQRPPLVVFAGSTVRCHHLDVADPGTDHERATPGGPSGSGRAQGVPVVPLLVLRGVTCRYGEPGRAPVVVDHVDLEIGPGETVGIVGESGSGKSTLLRAVAGIHRTTEGEATFEGAALPFDVRSRTPQLRSSIQLIFQNSDLSLNPRRSVGEALTRSLKLFRPDIEPGDRQEQAASLLGLVGLPGSMLGRLPGELSGGQRQRVAFARAFASRPKVLLCDEVTSALDVSVQASVLELIEDLAARFDTAVIFVSHDLAVVRAICSRIYVMRHGVVTETATTEQLFSHPTDSYTKELLAAAPSAGLTLRQDA